MTQPALAKNKKTKLTAEKRAKALLRKGQAAFKRGDAARAHLLWQQSAYINPKDVMVWLALYRVVTTDDDRRTCLENALRLRPDPQIAQQLKTLNKLKPRLADPQANAPQKPAGRPSMARRVLRVLMSGTVIVLLFIFGLFVGMMLNTWLGG